MAQVKSRQNGIIIVIVIIAAIVVYYVANQHHNPPPTPNNNGGGGGIVVPDPQPPGPPPITAVVTAGYYFSNSSPCEQAAVTVSKAVVWSETTTLCRFPDFRNPGYYEYYNQSDGPTKWFTEIGGDANYVYHTDPAVNQTEKATVWFANSRTVGVAYQISVTPLGSATTAPYVPYTTYATTPGNEAFSIGILDGIAQLGWVQVEQQVNAAVSQALSANSQAKASKAAQTIAAQAATIMQLQQKLATANSQPAAPAGGNSSNPAFQTLLEGQEQAGTFQVQLADGDCPDPDAYSCTL